MTFLRMITNQYHLMRNMGAPENLTQLAKIFIVNFTYFFLYFSTSTMHDLDSLRSDQFLHFTLHPQPKNPRRQPTNPSYSPTWWFPEFLPSHLSNFTKPTNMGAHFQQGRLSSCCPAHSCNKNWPEQCSECYLNNAVPARSKCSFKVTSS